MLRKLALTAILTTTALAAHAEGELKLYNWFEYIPQELLDKFTAETGINVVMDTYDSNEALLAALKAGKLGEYDLAVPGDYMVQILGEEGLLDSFTPDELSNFGNIEEQWLNVPFDEGRHSSIPYQWGTTSFAVNREVYDGPIDSLAMVFDPPAEVDGKINVLDTPGETLTLASLFIGIPQCTSDRDQLRQLNDTVIAAKEHWASFGSDTAKDVLVSGDAAVGMIWSGFASKAREEGAPIEYSFPKEGYLVWMDNLALLKDAPNRDNALKFMDFMLVPENAAALTDFAAYNSGVKGAKELVNPDIANSPENNAPADGNGVFVETCPQEVQELYDAVWTNLKK